MRRLKVFNGKRVSQCAEYKGIQLTVDDTSLKIAVVFSQSPAEELEREQVFDLAEYAGKVVQLNFHSDVTPMNLKPITLFEYVDRNSEATNLSNNLENGRSVFGFCRLIFDEDIFVCFFDDVGGNMEVSGASVQLMSIAQGKTLSGTILDQSGLFAQKYEKFSIKAKMMSAVDQYNSIAYLECQVDVLTRIVRSMLLKVPVSISRSLLEVLNKADELSVLDIKDIDKVMEELGNKKHIRELQQEYYYEKSAN